MRDVERAMKVITWFYSNSNLIVGVIEDGVTVAEESSEDESDEDVKEVHVGEDMDEDSDEEIQVVQVI